MSRKKLLDPIPPGEILLEEFMRPLGLSMNALARDIDVPANGHNSAPGARQIRTLQGEIGRRAAWIGHRCDFSDEHGNRH